MNSSKSQYSYEGHTYIVKLRMYDVEDGPVGDMLNASLRLEVKGSIDREDPEIALSALDALGQLVENLREKGVDVKYWEKQPRYLKDRVAAWPKDPKIHNRRYLP